MLEPRDVSILTQVAFKAAVDGPDDILSDDGAMAFEARFSAYTESLFTAVNGALTTLNAGREAEYAERKAQLEAEKALKNELGADDYDGYDGRRIDNQEDDVAPRGASVKIVGKDSGQGIPIWLIEQCAAKGVTAVFDNRPVDGKGPWFKEAVDTQGMSDSEKKDARYNAVPFWPPKQGGRR